MPQVIPSTMRYRTSDVLHLHNQNFYHHPFLSVRVIAFCLVNSPVIYPLLQFQPFNEE